ncbi:MAG: sulfite exporter TauE/SafE family protein [Bacteroides sp.]|nr:sulfite exporter TauE/SafE family protein [Bacteroides sp.]
MTDILFLVGILLIAILYSSVGHGGASGYLAFMALLGFAPEVMRPAALILNIFVSSIAFVSFTRNGHFNFKLLWPFIITSIPFAFLGGTFSIDTRIYKIILGLFLLFAIVRMLLKVKNDKDNLKEINILSALIIGAFLGFFSGLIGIGGGIILSPIIILLGWGTVKQTAAVSAAFILVNSIAGLSGFVLKSEIPDIQIMYMVIAGLMGGLLGSWLGSFRIKENYLRYTLALVLLMASVKLFLF